MSRWKHFAAIGGMASVTVVLDLLSATSGRRSSRSGADSRAAAAAVNGADSGSSGRGSRPRRQRGLGRPGGGLRPGNPPASAGPSPQETAVAVPGAPGAPLTASSAILMARGTTMHPPVIGTTQMLSNHRRLPLLAVGPAHGCTALMCPRPRRQVLMTLSRLMPPRPCDVAAAPSTLPPLLGRIERCPITTT